MKRRNSAGVMAALCGSAAPSATFAVALLISSMALAATPYRVLDLNPKPNPALASNANQMVVLGDRVIFSTANFVGPTLTRAALWSTDGSSGQTREITTFSGQPANLTVAGGYVYFVVGGSFPSAGEAVLWRTDGTAEGTAPLQADASIHHLTALGDEIAFFTDGGGGTALHVGSVNGGTRLIHPLPGPVREAAVAGNRLFFIVDHSRHDGPFELWVSDATTQGTVPVHAFTDLWGRLQPVGPFVMFTSSLTDRHELWRSDGSAEGTLVVATFFGADGTSDASTVVDGHLYFAADDGEHGMELWVSDATPGGTRLVADLTPGGAGSFLARSALIGREIGANDGQGHLLFPVRREIDGAGPQTFTEDLWQTDGTEEGTVLLAALPPGVRSVSLINATVLPRGIVFLAEEIVPTAAGRRGDERLRLRAIPRGTGEPIVLRDWPCDACLESDPSTAVRIADRWVFSIDDQQIGQEPWKTDGTAEGTEVLADIHAATDHSDPSFLGLVGDRLYFFANDGEHGFELHVSDGTASGTRMIADLNPGPADAVEPSDWLGEVRPIPTGFGGRVYFAADDGVSGVEPWSTDGTAGGTTRLADLAAGRASSLPGSFVAAGGWLYFRGNQGFPVVRDALWRTDGAGTIASVTFPTESPIRDLEPVGERLYVGRADGLWYVDTDSPEAKLLVARPEADNLVAVGDILYFGSQTSPFRYELVKTFGRPEHTFTLRHFNREGPSWITPVGDLLYFSAPSVEPELWKSDGTATDTSRVRETRQGGPQSPHDLVAFGDGVLFGAGTKSGEVFDDELWRSDGTFDGTVRVRDINTSPGEDGSAAPRQLTAVGEEFVVFSATTPETGREPWRTDGTAEGTLLLGDLAPGPRSSEPRDFVMVGNRLLFSADDGSSGRELWAIEIEAPVSCDGDCDGSTVVTIDELVRGVNIALGTAALESCPAFDSDRNGRIGIEELVGAVNSSLSGCPVPR